MNAPLTTEVRGARAGGTAAEHSTRKVGRHPGCPGCCWCLPAPEPDPEPEAPEPTPAWLLAEPDPTVFFRRLDYFVVQVLIDPRTPAERKLAACRRYYRAHGEDELLAALDAAAGQAPLEDPLARVQDRIRSGKGVAG